MRFVTQDLAGIGGAFKVVPEDFVVEEIPAYLPSGEGAHTYLWVEKRGLNTDDAVNRLAAALGVRAHDAGVAGQKDRHALTRQWISLPGVDPARAEGLVVEGARVLAVSRHANKLRTGHLRGNRFDITVRGVVKDALERAHAILARLEAVGLPNYYGAQRFGARGDNAARGKALVSGASSGRQPARGERRMLISAYQSELFNRWLDARIDDGLVGEVLVGDVVQRSDSGGVFWVAAAEHADAVARAARGEIVVTGPMFGHKMMRPPTDTPAAVREQAIAAEEGLAEVLAGAAVRDFDGARRALVVRPTQVALRPVAADAIAVAFALPSGAYATQLLAELTRAPPKPDAE